MKQLLILIGMSLSINIHAQLSNDSTVVSDKQSRKDKISSLRNLLIDDIIEKQTEKINEDTKSLMALENDYYVSLYPGEKWTIFLITKNYSELTNELANIDTAAFYSIDSKVRPDNDGLGKVLNQKLTQNSAALVADIQASNSLSAEDKSILLLMIKDLTIRERDAQEKMNQTATTHLKSFPQGKYDLYVKVLVRYEYKIKGFVWGMELFAGPTLLSGKISETFGNGGMLGLGFIWGIGNFQLNTRYFVGICSMNKNASYAWTKEMGCSTIAPELSLSYVFHPCPKITLAPVVGAGWFVVSPPLAEKNKNTALKNVDYASSAAPVLGIDLGWEFFKDFYYNYVFKKPMARFSSLNIRYTIQPTQYPDMPNFSGGMLQTISLGVKMGVSGAKRVF